jgi:hypothetical protein
MRVTNITPLGCSLVLPVGTVNCFQTLKAIQEIVELPNTHADKTVTTVSEYVVLTMNSVTTLKAIQEIVELHADNLTMNSVTALMTSHTIVNPNTEGHSGDC